MLSYEVYKILHLLGMFLVFVAIGGVCVHAANGGDKDSNSLRRSLAVSHGIGLVLLLIAGFGMLAKTGQSPAAGWVWGKVAIWLVLGASTALPYRARGFAGVLLTLVPLLGVVAAYLAINKPF